MYKYNNILLFLSLLNNLDLANKNKDIMRIDKTFFNPSSNENGLSVIHKKA